MILGHEGAGIVESVGVGVTKLKAGKRVFESLILYLQREITLFMDKLSPKKVVKIDFIPHPRSINTGWGKVDCSCLYGK